MRLELALLLVLPEVITNKRQQQQHNSTITELDPPQPQRYPTPPHRHTLRLSHGLNRSNRTVRLFSGHTTATTAVAPCIITATVAAAITTFRPARPALPARQKSSVNQI